MLEFLIKYKKYIIGLVIVIVLLLSFNWYVARKESAAYDRGFESANVQWIKKGKEYVAIIDNSKNQNAALNEKLEALSEQKRVLEERLSQDVAHDQIEYNKSPAARNKGLDDNFIDLYNKSLGD